MLENLIHGFELVLQWQNLLFIVLGAFIGYIAGILPGLGGSVTIALLLPFTFSLDPITGFVFLITTYIAVEYGSSITAIAINVPGEPGAAATTFDGYALTKKGLFAKALGMSQYASLIGGLFSSILLILLAKPIVGVAIKFGPPEFFALGIFGLTLVASLSGGSLLKGFICVAFGLMLTTVGIDPISGAMRYTFGSSYLMDGIDILPVLIGLFAISQLLIDIEDLSGGSTGRMKFTGSMPTLREVFNVKGALIRGSIIGFIVGVIPGAGKSIAAFIAYGEQKRSSKNPELYGTGVLEGIAAPESSNSAVVGGSLVPLLTLGIPGSPTGAILIGALTLHGLQAGPRLMMDAPELVNGIFATLIFGFITLCIFGLLCIPIWLKVVSIPMQYMSPVLLVMVMVSAYSVNNQMYYMWLSLIFGVIGYFMRKYDFPIAPVVLAFVLGELIETSLQRSVILSNGDMSYFLTRPAALILLFLALASVGYQMYRSIKKTKTNDEEKVGGHDEKEVVG